MAAGSPVRPVRSISLSKGACIIDGGCCWSLNLLTGAVLACLSRWERCGGGRADRRPGADGGAGARQGSCHLAGLLPLPAGRCPPTIGWSVYALGRYVCV